MGPLVAALVPAFTTAARFAVTTAAPWLIRGAGQILSNVIARNPGTVALAVDAATGLHGSRWVAGKLGEQAKKTFIGEDNTSLPQKLVHSLFEMVGIKASGQTEDLVGKSLGILAGGFGASMFLPESLGGLVKFMALGLVAYLALDKTGLLNGFNNAATAAPVALAEKKAAPAPNHNVFAPAPGF